MDIISAEQLSEWEAYDRLEPIGMERIEMHFATLCSVITNLFIKALSKGSPKLSTPLDFAIRWDRESDGEQSSSQNGPVQTLEEQKKALMGIATWAGRRKKDGVSRNPDDGSGVRHRRIEKG